jgi:hemolysin TlyA family protein
MSGNHPKVRLDVAMVAQGLAPTRNKAQALVMSGQVYQNEKRLDKAGLLVPQDIALTVRGETLPFVSRGGLKLQKALSAFSLDLSGKICIDAGASTGGFTDCMLQSGASKVYAVDVGYGQLAWSLRSDGRVVVLERTNVRYLDESHVPELVDFASADVSFISLRLILPAIRGRLKESGEVVCLVKPQFEAGREFVGKKGVVRDAKVHLSVLEQFLLDAQASGFTVKAFDFSPIRGPEGNIEYLAYLTTGVGGGYAGSLSALVEASHEHLEEKV